MWIFTTRGFVSVVEHHTFKGVLVVRARTKKHLESILSCVLSLTEIKAMIRRTEETDYRYRALISAALMQDLMKALVSEVDYPNFKEAVASKCPNDDAYCKALAEVWFTMYMMTFTGNSDDNKSKIHKGRSVGSR